MRRHIVPLLTGRQQSAITTIGMGEGEACGILDMSRGNDLDVFTGLQRIVIRNWRDGKEDSKEMIVVALRKVTKKKDLEVVLGRYCQPGTSVHGYMWTASLFVTCLLILIVYIIARCSSINTTTFFSLCVRCCPVKDLTGIYELECCRAVRQRSFTAYGSNLAFFRKTYA
jgi:hypothetical protein